ncbi:MAG: hypothetical protein IT373_16690, partial [Polyangiaceae bacterium]|nr:hypothetical protein [Polyangiaceae bacterium]
MSSATHAAAAGRPAPVVSHRALALDAGAIAVVSVAIALAAHELVVMSIVIGLVIAARFALWLRLPLAERGLGLGRDAALFVGLAVVGGFNDWNTVCAHRVYDYLVPVELPELSTIPGWMLVYWGLILRFVLTLSRSAALGAPARPRNDVWLGPLARLFGPAHATGGVVHSAALKLGLELALVVATRQLIYRLWDDPVLSWLPFAVALGFYALWFRPGKYELRLATLFALGGPVVEVLYIAAGLHRYALGWLGGVPVWILLWWVLGMLLVADFGARLFARLAPAA